MQTLCILTVSRDFFSLIVTMLVHQFSAVIIFFSRRTFSCGIYSLTRVGASKTLQSERRLIRLEGKFVTFRSSFCVAKDMTRINRAQLNQALVIMTALGKRRGRNTRQTAI